MRALGLAALSLLIALPAFAGSVDCEERSLGGLSRDAEAIALVKVSPAGEARVRLEPVRALKGKLAAPLEVDLELEAAPQADARGLVFLRRDEGAWSCLELILLASPAEAEALTAALKARLGPKAGQVPALLSELLSKSPRVRRDAALDLVPALRVGPKCRRWTKDEREQVARALESRPTLELLFLCAEAPAAELAGPLLDLARSAPHPTLQAAVAKALAACDRKRALEVWGRELEEQAPVERLLGYLGGEAAGRLLSAALGKAQDRARRLSLLCALSDCGSARASVVAQVARAPRHPGEARLALAVLARCSEGRALKDLHQTLADEGLRALAHALRRDPVELARRVQREFEEELRRLQEAAQKDSSKEGGEDPPGPKPKPAGEGSGE